MKKYKEQEVTERQSEDIVRKMPDSIEDGLRYVDHQKRTQRGPLDVLFVDSGNALVVARALPARFMVNRILEKPILKRGPSSR